MTPEKQVSWLCVLDKPRFLCPLGPFGQKENTARTQSSVTIACMEQQQQQQQQQSSSLLLAPLLNPVLHLPPPLPSLEDI